jgi:hypothetical protein
VEVAAMVVNVLALRLVHLAGSGVFTLGPSSLSTSSSSYIILF